jgi:antitoxin component YwqK of YwqJK toxin-antitoxin module
MKASTLKCWACVAVALTALAAQFGIVATSHGQERGKESVKIKPYTGPPIFLDEVEQVAEPTIVRRVVESEKFKDEKIRIEREIAFFSDNHAEADGKYREFYPNGQVFVEGQYKRGRQDGEWTYYYDNGKINRKAKFNNGKPDGPREIFRADGTLMAKRSFANGQRDGEWITYDATGKTPLTEEHYKHGKEDGIWKYWYPNGKLRQQVSFKDGVREGLATEWDDKGEKRFEATYAEGKLHGTATRWFPDGRKVVQQYDQGKMVSQSS